MVSQFSRVRYSLVTFLILLALALLTATGVISSARALPAVALSPRPGVPGDPRELGKFLDQAIESQLAENHIPGATIAVVKDGRLLFAKGYGYADLQHGIRVDAATTLFRIASVSKLFVWTAVMQLVEQGKLDLHTDVNRYLKTFQIPATYPQPITMAHLLTHTAGFEESVTGSSARTPEELEPLGTWLATHIPARVRPPGKLASYSNYGADLAGYIVEQVSGIPFDQYIEEHIFRPLNMTRSTFRQPVPADLKPYLSQGYIYTNGVNHAAPFDYMQDAPSGAMSSTATDMANFMLAHLQNGRFDNQRILQDATAQEMHTQHFTSDIHLPGMDYGFYEMRMNGLHLIGHSGDILNFHSLLALLPAQKIGLFVSYNSSQAGRASEDLLQAFLNRYFPAPRMSKTFPPLAGFAGRAEQITGTYLPVRRNYTTFEKFFMLFLPASSSSIHVNNAGNGHLLISTAGKQGDKVVEVAPWVFQQEGGSAFVVFQKQNNGTIMFVKETLGTYSKVAWYDELNFHYLLLLVCALIFLSAFLLWLVSLSRSRLRHTNRPGNEPLRCNLGRWLIGVVSAIDLSIMITLLIVFLTNQGEALGFGMPPWLILIFILAIISALLSIGTALYAAFVWGKRCWRPALRIHYTLVVLAALAFTWELAYWNFLGFRV